MFTDPDWVWPWAPNASWTPALGLALGTLGERLGGNGNVFAPPSGLSFSYSHGGAHFIPNSQEPGPALSNGRLRSTYLLPGTQFGSAMEFTNPSGSIGRYYNQDVLEALARKALAEGLAEDGEWGTFEKEFNIFDVVERRPVDKSVEGNWWISTPHKIISDGSFEARVASSSRCELPGGGIEQIVRVELRNLKVSSVLTDNIDVNAFNEQTKNWRSNPVKKYIEGTADIYGDKALQMSFDMKVPFTIPSNEGKVTVTRKK